LDRGLAPTIAPPTASGAARRGAARRVARAAVRLFRPLSPGGRSSAAIPRRDGSVPARRVDRAPLATASEARSRGHRSRRWAGRGPMKGTLTACLILPTY